MPRARHQEDRFRTISARAQPNSGEPDQDGIPEGAGNARNMHGGG